MYVKSKWEKQANKIVTEEEWLDICKTALSGFSSPQKYNRGKPGGIFSKYCSPPVKSHTLEVDGQGNHYKIRMDGNFEGNLQTEKVDRFFKTLY